MTYAGRIEARFTIPTGGAAMSVTTNAGGPTTVTVAAGSYYISEFMSTLQAALIAQRTVTAGTWVCSISMTATGTGRVTIQATNGTWSLSWTNTTLRDLLGFTGDLVAVSGAQTGTYQARGLWRPDCPMNIDGDPRMAPKIYDTIAMAGPTGDIVAHTSNVKRRHRGLRWTAVPIARYREASADTVNASWETFLDDTQHGQGSISWFTPCSKIHIYTHDLTQIGEDFGVTGWYMSPPPQVDDAKQVADGWTGLWRIDIAEITTSS